MKNIKMSIYVTEEVREKLRTLVYLTKSNNSEIVNSILETKLDEMIEEHDNRIKEN